MTAAFFCQQVLALAAFLVWQTPAAYRVRAGAALGLLLTVTGILAFGGRVPPPAMIAVAFVLTTVVGLSPFGKLLASHIGIGTLIGFQGFRVFVEVFLWIGFNDGFVPAQMTWEGWNFDVFTGLTAPVVAWFVVRGRLPRVAVLVWNCAGLALLVTVVSIAILSMPVPFLGTVPYIWLPTFLVQAAWLGHLLLFRKLRQ